MSSEPENVTTPEPVLRVTDAARALVLEARSGEPDPDGMALFVEVSGADGGTYQYDMWFESPKDSGDADAVQHHDDLVIVVGSSSVSKIRGATLDVGEAGLVMLNPNTPPTSSPAGRPAPASDLTSPVEIAVLAILDGEINPQLASHGGHADLVAVDEGVAYLRLSGGCQGCGLAAVTLTQGIAVAIREAVPEIVDIVDVTSHEEGTNPYFEAAKK